MISLILLKLFTFSQILQGVPKLSHATVYIYFLYYIYIYKIIYLYILNNTKNILNILLIYYILIMHKTFKILLLLNKQINKCGYC